MTEIDECLEGIHDCDDDATCTNERQDLLLVPVIQDIMVQLTGMTHVQVSLHYY